MKMELTCQVCGNNRFSFSDAQTDDGPVRCVDCGHQVGTLGSLKARVEEAVLKNARQGRD